LTEAETLNFARTGALGTQLGNSSATARQQLGNSLGTGRLKGKMLKKIVGKVKEVYTCDVD